MRGNALVGYGLVVGLDGSGDRTSQAPFTVQSLKNLLGELGVNVPANVNPQLKNVAAVAIHAELPPFAKPGQPIDITVSSIANAVSLRGGSLLMAPLKGADGQVYAMAQGNLVVGGFGAQGKDGSRVSVNIPSVGRIPNGATVERALPDVFAGSGEITLNLHQNDFTTVSRMVAAIDNSFGAGTARAVDGVTVSVRSPTDPSARIGLLARLENVELARRCAGQGGGQCTHRHGGDRPAGAGDAGGDRAWLAHRDHQRKHQCQPARAPSVAAAPRSPRSPPSRPPPKVAACSSSKAAPRSTRSFARSTRWVRLPATWSPFSTLKQAGALTAELEVI